MLLQAFDPANLGALLVQLQADMQHPAFWLAVGKIIWINVLLSGDNALVIAMACRGLVPEPRARCRPLGAPSDASGASGETAVPLSIRRPKKRGPFQAVPVIARAMMDRLA